MDASETQMLLGRKLTGWRQHEMDLILRFFNVSNVINTRPRRREPGRMRTSKAYLAAVISHIVDQYGLDKSDRFRIIRAYANHSDICTSSVSPPRWRISSLGQPELVQDFAYSNDVTARLALLRNTVLSRHARRSGVRLTARYLPEIQNALPARQDCKVCLEQMLPSTTPFRAPTHNCTHSVDVCSDCLQNSIRGDRQRKLWNDIGCPSCGETLVHADIEAFADQATRERYAFHMTKKALESGPEAFGNVQFRFCRIGACNNGQFCFNDSDSYMVCNACHGKTCISCDTAWHGDLSCVEALEFRRHESEEQRSHENAASTALIAANTKKCPQNQCGVPILKHGGCNHMTCGKCKYEFCWLCMADYERILRDGNHRHERGCPYFVRYHRA